MKVDENAAGNLLISFMRIRKKGELYVKEEKEKSDKKIVKINGCNLPVINDKLFGT